MKSGYTAGRPFENLLWVRALRPLQYVLQNSRMQHRTPCLSSRWAAAEPPLNRRARLQWPLHHCSSTQPRTPWQCPLSATAPFRGGPGSPSPRARSGSWNRWPQRWRAWSHVRRPRQEQGCVLHRGRRALPCTLRHSISLLIVKRGALPVERTTAERGTTTNEQQPQQHYCHRKECTCSGETRAHQAR